MWWLVVPVVGLVGKLVIDAFDSSSSASPSPPPRQPSILERNLTRLSRELRDSDATRVALLGQPGAGKSSLLKKMTKSRVRPLPIIGAQTDATDWASDDACNLLATYKNFVFADVPGYDTVAHPTDVFIDNFPFHDFDVYLFIVRGKLREADERMFQAIAASDRPVCIARSFAESCDDDERELASADLQRRLGLEDDHHVGFFSNRTGEGCSDLFDAITACHC